MGLLDDLKRQADAVHARQQVDSVQWQRQSARVDAACKAAFVYFDTLAQQLNVLRPHSKAVFRLDHRHALEDLQLCDVRVDARRKMLRGSEVFDHVILHCWLRSGRQLVIAKDFPPDIEKLEARMQASGLVVQGEPVRDAESGKLLEVRYTFIADFRASMQLLPEHEQGSVRFQMVNLDPFETVSVDFPPHEVTTARLDELGRWLLGEPQSFLAGGENLRRGGA